MKNSFSKSRYNPIDLMRQWWPNADLSHIDYDPKMIKGDYDIVRQSGGDGTLLFTIQMLQESLLPLVNKQSYFKPENPVLENVVNIRYTIGPMKHVICFGMVELGGLEGKKYPGQHERVRIPVCAYLEYKKGENQC
jgi:hypothetical protein